MMGIYLTMNEAVESLHGVANRLGVKKRILHYRGLGYLYGNGLIRLEINVGEGGFVWPYEKESCIVHFYELPNLRMSIGDIRLLSEILERWAEAAPKEADVRFGE